MRSIQTLAFVGSTLFAIASLAAEGPYVFRDVAAEMGISEATRGMMAHAAAWGDVDRDGQFDLWIGSFADRKPEVYQDGGAAGPVPNMLLRGGKERFLPVDSDAIAWKGRATGGVMVDFDNDGWTELYVSNNGRLGKENLLYRNNQGTLELVNEQAGAEVNLPDVARGVGVFDYDGNGLLDILVLATVGKGESMLFQNVGNMQFKRSKANSRLVVDASKQAIAESSASIDWPPRLVGAANGTIILETDKFLEIPAAVTATRDEEGIAPFVMANAAPTVDLAFHDELGSNPASRRLWSSWGDICVASDGSVYVGIGDHHHDAEGDGRCFIYRWDPTKKKLTQVVDMNKVVPPQPGQPAWTKVHAKIDEGRDGRIYFCCTLNAGSRAGDANYKWTRQLPGAQLYQYDPATGETVVFANLPPKRCTATSLLDAQRNVWWCNLEAGEGDALFGLDLATKRVVYQSPDGTVAFNRNFALSDDSTIYFNGADSQIMQLDPQQQKITGTGVVFPEAPGMRASTRQSTRGDIFGATYKTNQLFRYHPQHGELEMLGPTWGTGQYTTVMELSPDERFVYYMPGAHGQAFKYGTPVIQYEIATKTRKVLAFLAPALEEQIDYVPGGTYGIKVSKDGETLYVNFNGHAADPVRPAHMKPIGFGLCSFAAIHIPPSER